MSTSYTWPIFDKFTVIEFLRQNTPPKQLTRTFGLVTNVLQLYYPQKLDISGGRTLLVHFTMLVVQSIA